MPDPKPKLNAPKPIVTPPVGYTLQEFNASVIPNSLDVPNFIRQGIDMSKIRQVPAPPPKTEDDKSTIAYVLTSDPYKININRPALYGKPVLNHELTHTFQNTRSPDLGRTAVPLDFSKPTTPKTYDYGGVEGLKKAKSIAEFNVEQQAKIVQDYKAKQNKYLAKVKAGKATPAVLREFYEAHQAYHPLVKQLAAMPGADAKLQPSMIDLIRNRNIPTLDLKTEAPGLPSYDTPGLGVVPADPLLGGQSQPTQKVGATKRFKSGKMGVWDGHGWRATQ